MKKKSKILQPGDTEALQLGLFSATNTGDFSRLADYPPVYRDSEGFRKVLAGVTDLCGLDFEFSTTTLKPTVIGISNYIECAAVWYTPEVMEWVENHRRSTGFSYSGHAVLTADRQVLEQATGSQTSLTDWSDSMLTFWLANADLCKAPSKEEDQDGGLGFMGLGTMVSMTTDLPHHKTCRGRNCEELICPRHDVRGYCAIDAYGGLMGDIRSRETLRTYGIPESSITFLHRLAELSKKMSDYGVAVDRRYVGTLNDTMAEEQEKLFPGPKEDGYIFNPRSPKAVLDWGRDNKIFFNSTDKDAVQTTLEKLAAEHGYQGEKFEDVRDQLDRDMDSLDPVLKTVYNLYTYKVLGKGTDSWFHERYFGSDGLLHPRFVVTGTSTGRFSSSRPNYQNCFDAETEILTPTGWVPFPDIEEGMPVAQWDESGEISFVVPEKIHRIAYTGEMVTLKNEHIDLRVTADHRCPLISRKTDEFRVVTAAKYVQDHKQVHAGDLLSGTDTFSWDLIRLLLATQADGNLNGYGASYRFKKRRKYERLVEILDCLNLPYSFDAGGNRGYFNVYLKKCETVRWLEETLGAPKILPNWLLHQSYRTRERIIDEVCFWDGHSGRNFEYYSKHKANCDLVQAIATTVGVRTIQTFYENSTGGSCWIVRITKRDYSLTTNISKIVSTTENEMVYCVTVPSSFVVVRRNNRTAISGNCPKRGWGKKVRKAFVPREAGNVLVEADFSQLELRVCLYLAGVDPAIIGEDAFSWLVTKSGGLFDKAAERFGGKPRDIAKSISHAANYLEGLRLLDPSELDYSRTKSEVEAGALRVYHPRYMDEIAKEWTFHGKVVAFTGSNLAQRLFKSKSFENRRKALEIQEGIYFKAFPQIRAWQQRALGEAEAKGYVSSPAGRFLRLYDTPEKNAKVIVAFLGQGVGASHVQSIMLQYNERHGTVFLGQIHDALLAEFPLAGGYKQILSTMKEMEEETSLLPGFRCPCKVEVGKHWGAMEELSERDGELYLGKVKVS